MLRILYPDMCHPDMVGEKSRTHPDKALFVQTDQSSELAGAAQIQCASAVDPDHHSRLDPIQKPLSTTGATLQ